MCSAWVEYGKKGDVVMTKYLIAYAASAIVMIAIDLVWLGFIAKSFYQQGIGHLMADSPNIPAAVAFYLLFPVGTVFFAVMPNAMSGEWSKTLIAGALFGFFCYATYDLTNLATLKNWPLSLSLLDTAWGTLVTAISAAAGKYAIEKFATA
jgi:uncharacterized membrane protein